MRHYRTRIAVPACAAVIALCASACGGSGSSPGNTPGGVANTAAGSKIGIDFPRSDSDFWSSYQKYMASGIKDPGVDALKPTNSDNKIDVLIANVKTLTGQGAKAIIMAPQDTDAIAGTLDELAAKNIPVVSVDTRPNSGKVYMVVRANNKAYGEKACKFLGAKLGGKGTVVEFEGSQDSINGAERTATFASCMSANFPNINVVGESTDWRGDVASTRLQNVLNLGITVNAVYMQAGGVFLAPTIALLKQRHLLVPPTDPKHIFIMSSDGIPEEYKAIKAGQIDATISQPADLYAKYALFYAKAALAGQTFHPGPTDHQSTIISLPNGLEDQIPAPLVTIDNVNDPGLWANQLGK
jgi:ABC-type sugar transport system substrate-binding protein